MFNFEAEISCHCSKLIRQAAATSLGSAEWTAVFGSEDRSRRKIELPITDIRIHPNFVNYQNDIGKMCTEHANASKTQ